MALNTAQALNLASKVVNANEDLLNAVNSLQALIDEYNNITVGGSYTDGMFTGTSLSFLTASNLSSLITNVFPAFQTTYQDVAHSGVIKLVMNQCQT